MSEREKTVTMREIPLAFPCGELVLDGILSLTSAMSTSTPAVVICHSHPSFKGDMDHVLIRAIAVALAEHGIASLRFSFRGVGRSQGEFTNGEREGEDVEAALSLLSKWPGVNARPLGVVGHSLGAVVLLRHHARVRAARAMVCISPPPHAVEVQDMLDDPRQRLFLVGEADRIAPARQLRMLVSKMDPKAAQIAIIPGFDHQWTGGEKPLSRRVAEFFVTHLA